VQLERVASRITIRASLAQEDGVAFKLRQRRKGKLAITAENMGATLGRLAGRLDRLNRERRELAAELWHLLSVSQGLLGDLGSYAGEEVRRLRKGARPKGYKMSAATKRKLRAAWRRRKAAAKSGA
jgi:hypothetical protein